MNAHWRTRRRLRTAIFTICLAVPGPRPAAAQSGATAAIAGTVTDTAGAPVDGAYIVLADSTTGARAEALTDANGRFRLANLRPGGPYTLTITRLGAARAVRGGIRLAVGETRRIDVALTDEPVALEALEVTVEVDPVFSPSRTGAATFLDEVTLERLPTLSRDVLGFAALSPMVRVEEDGLSIAGQNQRYNAIRIDGALFQDVFGLSASGVPGGESHAKAVPLAAVEQYQVLVAPYDVRQSGFTGGLLNVVTKSGTNEWEGSVYGFFRDDALLGDVFVDGLSLEPDDYRRALGGFTIGGPLVRDGVHIFAAGEFERRRTPTGGWNLGQVDPLLTRLQPDSAATVAGILDERYGIRAGGYERATLENPIDNVFVRIDARLNDRHRLVVRHNLAHARFETAPNREPVDEYEFGSVGTRRMSTTNATAVQWFATPGSGISNEFLLNLQFGRSRTEPRVDAPLVEVDVASMFEGGTIERRVRAGGALFAHANELDQGVLQLRNDLTVPFDEHRLTFGAASDYTRIRRLLLPGSRGRYVFDSIDALRRNEPSLYERNLLRPGVEDAAVRFTLWQLSGYAQDEWTPVDGLALRFGLRFDVPMLVEAPFENAFLRGSLGASTSEVPGAHVLISPRFGFNWRPGDGAATQLRGGAGVLTGRPPLAWLANAFANSGLRTEFLTCADTTTPGLAGILSPAACAGGELDFAPPTINFLDPDFRFPQDFRVSMAVDRRLPLGFTGTLEMVYTRALRQVELEDVNLAAPVDDPQREQGYPWGLGDRHHFGTPVIDGFTPRRRDPRFGQVIRIGNGSGNYSYALSAEIRRTLGRRLTLRAAYAYARSGDAQSLIAPDVTANFGLTPITGDPVHPPLRPSLFDRPHKVSLAANARLPDGWGGGALSVLYVGQSGRPYSYVYGSDINGDGYAGQGVTIDADNDLFFVPPAVAGDYPYGLATRLFLDDLTALDPCLERSRGLILARNACRGPWSNRVDVRLQQPLRLGDNRVELVADVANVLNLLNADWGHVRRTAPVVPLLRISHRREDDADANPGPEPEDPLVLRYVGPVRRDPETGLAIPALPHTPAIPESQWQIQIGFRVRF